jgi:membrane protein
MYKIMDPTEKQKESFRIKHIPSLIIETAKAWNRDDPWRLSAIVAYYAILSLPGLLVVIISLLGYFWGPEIIEGKIYNEIKDTMGSSAADSLQSIFESSRSGEASWFSKILGLAALIFGATGVFYHLQISINNIWDIKSDPKNSILRYLIDRTRSFGFVLVVGFLLLITFVVSALLSGLQGYLSQWIPELTYYFFKAANIVIQLGFTTILFALIFKYLPDVHIGWRSVWVGALITSFLFAIGKEILAYYFGQASPGSTYGAAGSIIIILLWVSYSCLILFFGTEFTWIYTKRYGYKFTPRSHAKFAD